jgi:hypothetical protein
VPIKAGRVTSTGCHCQPIAAIGFDEFLSRYTEVSGTESAKAKDGWRDLARFEELRATQWP